jgi:hypothetical protein
MARTGFLLCAIALVACDRPTDVPRAAPSVKTSALSSVSRPLPTRGEATSPAAAVSPTAPATAGSETRSASGNALVTFDTDVAGAPSPAFESVVGDWYAAEEAGARGLKVDGAKWRNGTPSASLADQAKRLYGERYAEFLDGVKAFAFFPFAVWRQEPPAGDVRVSTRFYPIAGRIDQAAGIAFAIASDGAYLGVRVNALEDNLLYFRVVKGKRTIIDNVRDVPTPTKTWHTLSLEVRGTRLTAFVNGQKRFEKTLERAPQGRLGLWSKADSQVLFDEFKVEPLSDGSPAQKPNFNPAQDR